MADKDFFDIFSNTYYRKGKNFDENGVKKPVSSYLTINGLDLSFCRLLDPYYNIKLLRKKSKLIKAFSLSNH